MFKRVAGVVAVFFGLVPFVLAQQPRAAQNNSYEITPEAGPWAICITSFVEQIDRPAGRDFLPGELEDILAHTAARNRAIGFVTVLRKEPYSLRAYMFNRGDDERKKEEQRVAEEREERRKFILENRALGVKMPEKIYVKRPLHVEDQYVVLVGGYRSKDEARHALEGIRRLKPPPTEFCNKVFGAQGDQRYAAPMSPFVTAMVIPNPTNIEKLKAPPRDVNERTAELAEMVEMNSHNPLSPLGHEKKWTLIVKEYKIRVKVNDDGMRAKMYDSLGKTAESLAALLRNPGFGLDSYVIHTKYASYVTVGIFDSEKDQRLATMRNTLSTLTIRDPHGQIIEELMNPALPFQIQPLPPKSFLQSIRSAGFEH